MSKKEPKYNKDKNIQSEPTVPCEPMPGDPSSPGDPGDPGESDKNTDGLDPQLKQIMETGSITVTKGRHLIHCLTIIGQIEGHYILPPQNKTTKYEHVIPQIVAIEEDPEIEGLLIILNTVGGDVEAGLAIAELLAGMKKPTVSLVLGGGHSIGVPLAVSARQSFIAETATMTIHPVRMNGVVVGVPQTMGYFYRMQDRITRFVSENSGISQDRFKELMMNTSELVMDVGTVLDGNSAVKEGLIDHLGGLSDAIAALYAMIEEKASKAESEKDEGSDRNKTSDSDNLAEHEKCERRHKDDKRDGRTARSGAAEKRGAEKHRHGKHEKGSGGKRRR